tara:strand:- start:676 stop:876 length:201 start_codon:yes stop_codon:yes gene_type:complete
VGAITNDKNMFPHCSYQHITFTMPDVIWPVFKDHSIKLNDMIKIATKVLLDIAKEQGITIGKFFFT